MPRVVREELPDFHDGEVNYKVVTTSNREGTISGPRTRTNSGSSFSSSTNVTTPHHVTTSDNYDEAEWTSPRFHDNHYRSFAYWGNPTAALVPTELDSPSDPLAPPGGDPNSGPAGPSGQSGDPNGGSGGSNYQLGGGQDAEDSGDDQQVLDDFTLDLSRIIQQELNALLVTTQAYIFKLHVFFPLSLAM